MSKPKDTRLEEKEELVVNGTVLADEFRDRKTGKKIAPLGDKITVDEVDSGNATDGQVLAANGSGGASWENIPDPTSAQVLDALENQDLKVKTISQSEANTVYETTLGKAGDAVNLTENMYFSNVSIVNNILYFVGAYMLGNNTETNVTSGSLTLTFNVENDIGKKIICFTCEKVSDDYTGNRTITYIPLLRGSSIIGANLIKTGKNQITIDLPVSTINAGRSYVYTFRDFLTLI